jgi:hypothetical protein
MAPTGAIFFAENLLNPSRRLSDRYRSAVLKVDTPNLARFVALNLAYRTNGAARSAASRAASMLDPS